MTRHSTETQLSDCWAKQQNNVAREMIILSVEVLV